MRTQQITLPEINAFDQENFVAALGALFEGPPWIVAQAWHDRPFADLTQLHQALCNVMYSASIEQQVALLQAHPDLVGRAALAGVLTPASTSEQASAGLNELSPTEVATFTQLNQTYHDTFGFPFVICARENKKESILAGFAVRLQNSRSREIEIALGEVAKICWLRLCDTVYTVKEPMMSVDNNYSYVISYGKARVPVYRTYARPLTSVASVPESAFTGRDNILMAMEVDVEVFGENFLPAYTHGDNSMVVATDTMKNFILRQALAFDGSTLEGFLALLGHQFLQTYPEMERVQLTGRELSFAAAHVPLGEHAHFGNSDVLFNRANNDYGVASIDFASDGQGTKLTGHHCGRVGLQLLKVTGSAFTHFVRDAYTTLPERGDRPLFIYLDVHWKYGDPADIQAHYIPSEQVRDVVQTVFHEFVSESIQHLVHEMGLRLLERFPQLAEVSFDGQNRTRDPMGVSETDPKKKVYSDPFPAYGMIKLTMGRKG